MINNNIRVIKEKFAEWESLKEHKSKKKPTLLGVYHLKNYGKNNRPTPKPRSVYKPSSAPFIGKSVIKWTFTIKKIKNKFFLLSASVKWEFLFNIKLLLLNNDFFLKMKIHLQ